MAADDDLDALVADLLGVLRELDRDLEPQTVAGIPRPPTPQEFARFTSEVAIPGVILVLRVNIEALGLLQRTLRMADGRDELGTTTAAAVGDRARSVSRATLSRLDDTLADLQAAMEGRPEDEETRELLGRARDLQDQVDARLAAGSPDEELDIDEVPVDVEAELASIKRAVGDEGGVDDTSTDGENEGDESAGGETGDRSTDGEESS